jgi:hypothetical protein
MNRFPDETELRSIAKEWNRDNFDFYMDLDVSVFCRIFWPISMFVSTEMVFWSPNG